MILTKTTFRASAPDDHIAIGALHRRAFGRAAEGELAVALLASDTRTLDRVAELDGMIVGHAVLSAMEGPDRMLGLGPVGVDPGWRDFQIGTELVRQLIAAARADGWRAIFVLGDPVYYGRFGFSSALADQVRCAYQCPQFQALDLEPGAVGAFGGEVRYPPAFHAVD